MSAAPRLVSLVLVALLMAGCASSRTIEPGRSRSIFGEYRVESPAKWARTGFRNVEIWTVDGPSLQQLRFYAPLEDGDSLFEIAREAFLLPPDMNEDRPQMREWMTPHDVAEMVSSTMLQWGAVRSHSSGLRPASFGGRDGFRFELDFITPGGVSYRGLALGRIDEDQELYLIIYLGTADHYYPSLLADVEQILASISWR